jgi:hypothetical protein
LFFIGARPGDQERKNPSAVWLVAAAGFAVWTDSHERVLPPVCVKRILHGIRGLTIGQISQVNPQVSRFFYYR